MFEIKLKAIGNELRIVSQPDIITSGSVNVVTAIFEFDSAWDGMAKTVVFVFEDAGMLKKYVTDKPLPDDSLDIPPEVLAYSGYLTIGVWGTYGDERLPTIYSERLWISPGADAGGGNPFPPPPPDRGIPAGGIAQQVLAKRSDADFDTEWVDQTGGGGGESTIAWVPDVSEGGDLSWRRSGTTTPPVTVNIKGAPGKDGKDGTDGKDGIDGQDGLPGRDGVDGKDGTGVTILGSYDTYAELVTAHPTGSPGDAYMVQGDLYVWSGTWLNVGRIQGPQGTPGVSPTATVHKEGDTATITIADVNGTTTETISNGTDGNDGYSPSATVTQTATGARIKITDKDGTTITEVSNGADGGDGISPSVDVVEISGGHIVTITDADGTESFQVMDGGKGDPGQAATIEIGTVTTGEPGTDAVVENVGTDTAAVLEFTIPRGADGGGGRLPWCSGTFEDRSLVAGTWSRLKPIYKEGNSAMISNDKFVIPATGLYAISIGGAMFSTSATNAHSIIVLNDETTTLANRIGASIVSGTTKSVPTLTLLKKFIKDDYLCCYFNATPDQATFEDAGAKYAFTLALVNQEE